MPPTSTPKRNANDDGNDTTSAAQSNSNSHDTKRPRPVGLTTVSTAMKETDTFLSVVCFCAQSPTEALSPIETLRRLQNNLGKLQPSFGPEPRMRTQMLQDAASLVPVVEAFQPSVDAEVEAVVGSYPLFKEQFGEAASFASFLKSTAEMKQELQELQTLKRLMTPPHAMIQFRQIACNIRDSLACDLGNVTRDSRTSRPDEHELNLFLRRMASPRTDADAVLLSRLNNELPEFSWKILCDFCSYVSQTFAHPQCLDATSMTGFIERLKKSDMEFEASPFTKAFILELLPNLLIANQQRRL